MICAGFQVDTKGLKNITFREIDEKDRPFLCKLYGSSREAEMAVVPWTENQKQQFIQMQFDAQHQHYQEYFPHAHYLIIQQSTEILGRIYIDRRENVIALIDILLTPSYRNHGIGSSLLKILIEEAIDTSKCIQIHVEKNNPAMQLYQRLGFLAIEDKGVYELMEWKPENPPFVDRKC